MFQDLEAVKFRQLEIEQNDHRMKGRTIGVESGSEQQLDCLDSVTSYHDLVADVVFLERPEGQIHVVRIVFYQQDQFVRHWGPH